MTCLIWASVIWISHLSTGLPFDGCSSLYNFSFLHTPRPCRSACSGFSSPFLGRQRSPRVHGPVYTPHGWPSSSAHVKQQPQPGSFTSWQPTGTGGHMDRAFWSHGWQGTYDEPQPVMLSRGTTRKETLSSMARVSSKTAGCLTETATIINYILWRILSLQKVWVHTSGGGVASTGAVRAQLPNVTASDARNPVTRLPLRCPSTLQQ